MAVVTECIAFFIGKQRDISASICCGRNAHVLHIRVIKEGGYHKAGL